MEEEPGERARADGDHCNLLSSHGNISETENKPRIYTYLIMSPSQGGDRWCYTLFQASTNQEHHSTERENWRKTKGKGGFRLVEESANLKGIIWG
jgi:hypothetical protein